jgi:hypothetical protein
MPRGRAARVSLCAKGSSASLVAQAGRRRRSDSSPWERLSGVGPDDRITRDARRPAGAPCTAPMSLRQERSGRHRRWRSVGAVAGSWGTRRGSYAASPHLRRVRRESRSCPARHLSWARGGIRVRCGVGRPGVGSAVALRRPRLESQPKRSVPADIVHFPAVSWGSARSNRGRIGLAPGSWRRLEEDHEEVDVGPDRRALRALPAPAAAGRLDQQ